MSPRVTQLLVLLNLAVFGLLGLLTVGRERQERADADRRVLVPPGWASPSRIELDGPGPGSRRVLALRPGGAGWWLEEPENWPANPYAVERLLAALSRPGTREVIELGAPGSGPTPAEFGLAEPALTIRLFDAGGTPLDLALGRRAGAGADEPVFGRAGGSPRVHLLPPEFAAAFALPDESWRDTRVVHIPPFEARSLSVTLPRPASTRVRLARGSEGWRFEAPIDARADAGAVDKLLTQIHELQVVRVVPPGSVSPERTGLADPQLRVTVEGNGRRQSLLVGSVVGSGPGPVEVYARLEDRPAVFTVLSPVLDELLNLQEGLRDRELLPVDPGAVLSVTLAAPDRPSVTLQRGGEGRWQVVSRQPDQSLLALPAETALVSALLDRLTTARILAFVSDAPGAAELEQFLLARPQREIGLGLDDGSGGLRTVTLYLGGLNAAGDQIYVRRDDAPYVYAADAALLPAAPVSPLFFRDRGVLGRLAGLEIVAVRLRLAEADQARPPAASWSLAPGADANADPTGRALAQALAAVRARAYLTEDLRPPLDPLGAPRRWVWVLEFDVGPAGSGTAQQTISMVLWTSRESGEWVAGLQPGGPTFEPDRSFTAALQAWLPSAGTSANP